MFLFIIFVIVVVFITVKVVKRNSYKSGTEAINEIVQEQGIKATKYVDIPTLSSTARFIVDERNEKVWYIQIRNNGGNFIKSIEFKDVYKVELIRDGKIKIMEDHFSIFNDYNKKEYVKKLGVRISFNDMSFPSLDILFLNSTTGQTLTGLGGVVNATNNWIQIMQIVVERGKANK